MSVLLDIVARYEPTDKLNVASAPQVIFSFSHIQLKMCLQRLGRIRNNARFFFT